LREIEFILLKIDNLFTRPLKRR